MTEKTGKKQENGRFKKGQSGNPNGRPKGSLNKATLACQDLIDDEAESITRKAVELALDGNMMALKLCLERIVPPRKERPVNVDLPAIGKETDFSAFTQKLLEEVTSGAITIGEAQGILSLAVGHEKWFEKGKVLFDWP